MILILSLQLFRIKGSTPKLLINGGNRLAIEEELDMINAGRGSY